MISANKHFKIKSTYLGNYIIFQCVVNIVTRPISHPVFQQEVLKIPDPGGFISCDQMICECHLSPHVAPPGVRVEYGDKTHSSSQFVPPRR